MNKEKLIDMDHLYRSIIANILKNAPDSGIDPDKINGVDICSIIYIRTQEGNISHVSGKIDFSQLINILVTQMIAHEISIEEIVPKMQSCMDFMSTIQRPAADGQADFVDPRDFDDLKNGTSIEEAKLINQAMNWLNGSG